MDIDKRFQDNNERMMRLKNSYPFFKLYQYSRRGEGLDYDIAYLAIDVLSFIIEQGKLRSRFLNNQDIENHVQKVLDRLYPDKELDSREVTRSVLDVLETDTDGQTYLFEHIDPLHLKQARYRLSLIKYDVSEKGYEITTEGLDFMISTKELPEESRISIGLILFKKQIENHSFVNAYNTIRELNLNVIRKRELKEDLLRKMMYDDDNIIEDLTKFTEGVFSQLKEEEELFEQVRKSLEAIINGPDDLRNIKDSEKITEEDLKILSRIRSELKWGYELHSGLLSEYTKIPEEHEEICNNRLNSLFDLRWNFKDVLESNIKMNRLNETHVIEMRPLLLPEVPGHFSIFKIFEPQVVTRKKDIVDETRDEAKWEDVRLLDDQVKQRQKNNFQIYSYHLLRLLEIEYKGFDLERLLQYFEEKLGPEALYNIDLLPFLLALNIDTTTSDGELNAYQTIHEIPAEGRTDENEYDLIILALMRAIKETGLSIRKLIVTSYPQKVVPVCENGLVHISDMEFMIGEIHEV